MKKTSKSWIAAGLLTIVATITTIYCLLEYRNSVLIVGISSLFLLASAFWLFLSLSKLEKTTPTPSVGEEQRERMNYEGMKLQGEELIRLMNTLGKGTYVYSKRSSEHLEQLLNQTLQSQQANEALIQTLIQEQTKTAKFQVKYNQDDTSKLISALSDNCKQINRNLETCIDAISKPDTNTASSQMVTASLSDLSKELARINSSIQALQIQLTASVQQSVMHPVSESKPVTTLAEETPVVEPPVAETPITEIPATEPSVAEAPITEIPATEAQAELPSPEENAMFSQDDIDSLLANITGSAESETESAPVSESEPEPIAEQEVLTPEEATPPSNDVSSILSDDPNKQLSPDEIAALFAALG